MIEILVGIMKRSAQWHYRELPESARKRMLVRRILIELLFVDVGLSFKAIAAALECSRETVQNTVKRRRTEDDTNSIDAVRITVISKLKIISH